MILAQSRTQRGRRRGRNYEEIQNQWRILTKDRGVDIAVIDMHRVNHGNSPDDGIRVTARKIAVVRNRLFKQPCRYSVYEVKTKEKAVHAAGRACVVASWRLGVAVATKTITRNPV